MQQVNLNLVPGGVNPIVYASQNDDKRTIRFKLVSGSDNDVYVLSGNETITAKITKPDGTAITIPITNPGSGKHYVDLVNGADDYDLEGVYSGEIVLTRNSTIQGTANFILKVEADAYDGQVTTDTASGNPCTFSTDLADNVVSLKANIVASGGGGTPSTPIPIVGYSSANITRCGVNLFDGSKVTTTNPSNWGVSFDSDTSTLTIEHKNTYSSGIPVFNIPSFVGDMVISGTFGANIDLYVNGTWNRSMVSGTSFSCTSGNAYTLVFPNPSQSTLSYKVQLELGNTAHAFTTYNGQTYTVNFGQTVYGGVLDVTRGKLTDTFNDNLLDLGSLTWVKELSAGHYHYYSSVISGAKGYDLSEMPNILCTDYPTVTRNTLYNGNLGISFDTGVRAYIYDPDYDNESATGADVKTALSGVMIAYELATPFDIDLTPVQIEQLLGKNNVYHDCNGDTEVKYIDLKEET